MTTKLNTSITILPAILVGVLLLTGCDSSGGAGAGNVTIDAPALSGALKFLGVCSIICSLIWAVSLVFGSNRYEETRNRGSRS